jgi:hypothetical protein
VPEAEAQQVIDWSFFSMARYLRAADPADPSVLPGSAWDGFAGRPAGPGTPRRPPPARSLAETRDDWMAGWADQGHDGPPADRLPAPTARLLALGELDDALPAGTARITPAQRRAVLSERLRQVTRLQRA